MSESAAPLAPASPAVGDRALSGAFLATVIGSLGIGFAPVLAKLTVNLDRLPGGEILSPVAVGFWRTALATPVFGLLAWQRRGEVRPPRPSDWWVRLMPGVFIGLDLGIWHWSFEFTSVANATLLVNFAVVVVALVGWLYFKERFNAWFPVGALLALVGMALLVGFSFAGSGRAWIGDVMGLSVALAYAGYQLSSKVVLGRYPVNTVMAWTSGTAAAVLLLGTLLSPGRLLPVTAMGWAGVVGLAVVSQLVGQGLINVGLRQLPVGLASVVLVLQPVFAAVLGWLILGQALSPTQMMAGGLTILGIYLARRGSR